MLSIVMWDKEAKKLKTWRIIALFMGITFICSLITVERNLKPYFTTAVVSHPTVSFDHSELAPGTILLRQATIDVCTTTESELTFINKDTTVIYNVAEMRGQVRQQAQGGAAKIDKVIKGRTFFVSHLLSHFPHFAQNFFYLSSMFLKDMHMTKNLLFHFQSPGHAMKQFWQTSLLSLLPKISVLNPDFVNWFGNSTLFQTHCINASSSYIIQFEELVVKPSLANVVWFPTPRDCRNLRELVFKGLDISPNPTTNQTTILTRKGSRALNNADELIDILEAEFGLEVHVVDFDNAGFAEQVSIMANTKYLIAIHGAAFANVAFMQEGGVVIEVHPYMYIPSSSYYGKLARECGQYHYPYFTTDVEDAVLPECFSAFTNYTATQCSDSYPCRACTRRTGVRMNLKQMRPILQQVFYSFLKGL